MHHNYHRHFFLKVAFKIWGGACLGLNRHDTSDWNFKHAPQRVFEFVFFQNKSIKNKEHTFNGLQHFRATDGVNSIETSRYLFYFSHSDSFSVCIISLSLPIRICLSPFLSTNSIQKWESNEMSESNIASLCLVSFALSLCLKQWNNVRNIFHS